MRKKAFGENRITVLDRLGNYLSVRAIRRHLVEGARPYVLDLGSGYRARLLRALRPHLGTAHAVDIRLSDELMSLEGFRSTESPILPALLEIEPDQVDVVLLISVLEHLPNPVECLTEIRRVLKPGGKILINVPTWRGKWFLETAAFRLDLCPADEIDDHKMYYQMESLWPLLIQAGFIPSRINIKSIKFGLTLFAVCEK